MYNKKHPQAEGTDFETHSKFFWTPFWSNSIPEWVDKIDKACQVHLDWAHERESSKVEKLGSDFGMVYHSRLSSFFFTVGRARSKRSTRR